MIGVNCVVEPGKPNPLLNPGTLAALHHKCHSILPIWLDGAQFSYQNTSNPNHILFVDSILSHLRPSGVRCGLSFARDVGNSMLKSPFISIDLNPYTLSSNIYIQYFIMPSLRIEWKGQTLPITTDCSTVWKQWNQNSKGLFTCGLEAGQNTMTIDWYGPSSTVSLNIYNGGLLSGRSTVSYLQSLTPALTMGMECLLEWRKGDWQTKAAIAGRFARRQLAVAATYSISTGDMDMTYWRQVNPYLQLGTSFVYNKCNAKSIGAVHYQREFPNATIRAKLDSDSSIGFTYDQNRNDRGYSFGLSLLWCIRTNRFVCGFKLNMEPLNST